MRQIASVVLFFYFVATLSADDLVITEKSFGCVLDLSKVRNTRIQNSDPEKLKEAIRIFRDSVPDTEYPKGTILQLIPTEAMVKHDRAAFLVKGKTVEVHIHELLAIEHTTVDL